MPPRILCVCIGCGCDDEHACTDLLGDACSWVQQSGSGRRGVCSQCPTWIRLWNRGERKLSERAKATIAERKLMDRLSRPKVLSGK